jgi:hypothetical protein
MLQDLEALRRHFATADEADIVLRPGTPSSAKGARLIMRAAHKTRSVPKSYPLSADLGRLSLAIERYGFGAPQLAELARLLAHAATVQAETSEPVVTNVASAVEAVISLCRGPQPEAT